MKAQSITSDVKVELFEIAHLMNQAGLFKPFIAAAVETAYEFEGARMAMEHLPRGNPSLVVNGHWQPPAHLVEDTKNGIDQLVDEKIALLADRLGKTDAERINVYVVGFMKRNIKIVPSRSNERFQP